MQRCKWCNMDNPKYVEYHDNEWGKLNLDEQYLYEMLILESFQAGLSWECVLNKRDAFRNAYDNFNIDKVIEYNQEKINELINNKDIVRNKLKIKASINNSKIFKDIQNEYGSFSNYLKEFWDGNIIYENDKVTNDLSDNISNDLEKKGMKFVGSVIIYSYLQAIGIINSHMDDCFMKHTSKNNKKHKIIIPILIFFVVASLFILSFFLYFKNNKQRDIKHAKSLFKQELVKEIGPNEKIYKKEKGKIYIINKLNINNLKKFDELKEEFYKKYSKNHNYYVDYEVYYGPDNTIGLVIYEIIEEQNSKQIEKNIHCYNFNSNMEQLKDTYIFKGNYPEKLNELGSTTQYIITNDNLKLYANDNVIDISYDDIKDYMNIDYGNKTTSLKNININNEYIDSSEVRYSLTINNVYESANQNSKKIGDLYKGTKVEVINVGNPFSKIKYNDGEGYALIKYLTSNFVLKDGYKEVSDKRYINYKEVRIWPDDAKEGDPIAVLELGDEINRIGESDTWSVFKYNNKYAYVETENTDATKPKPENQIAKNVININIRGNSSIDPSKPMVALTYDDGPSPSSTVRILNTLEKYKVKATFFDVGSLAASYPEVTKREYEIGEVGSHTYSHYNLNNLSYAEIRSEVDKTDSVIESITGEKPVLLRPPYGNANNDVRSAIYDHVLVNWNVDTVDWKTRDRDSILNEIRKIPDLDGHIILMHSIYSSTADATEIIVPELLSKGYQLVTISELAKYRGYTLTSGKIYYAF